jgi:stringent starvation protein B
MAANEWTINYLPEDGGRLTGKLRLTDESVTFSALYDSSNKEIVKGISSALGAFAVTWGHASYFHDTSTDYVITLPRSEISGAELRKKGFMKQAVVTMKDGSQFVFDYGMLSPKNLVAAING